MKNSLFIGVMAIFLSGCIRLLPDAGPEPLRVDLKPIVLESSANDSKAEPLKIYLPTCSEALDSARIAISRQENNITVFDYIAEVEWKDRLPALVQQRLMQLLERSGHFKAVGMQNEKYNASYLLQTHIHRFEINQEPSSASACIEIVATLIRRYDHAVLQQKTFNIKVGLDEHSLNAFIQALDTGFGQLQTAYLEWIKNSINAL